MKIFNKKPSSKIQKPVQEEQIDDSRFKSVHYDPKFLPASKKVSKTAIDSRFSGLFTDKNFNVVSKKDKYGRDLEAEEKNNDMERLYYLKDEENNEGDNDNEEKPMKKKKKNNSDKKQGDSSEPAKKQKKSEGKSKKEKKSNQEKDEDGQEPEDPKLKKSSKKPIKTEDLHSKYYNSQGKFDWNAESSSDSGESELENPEENLWEEDDDKVIRNENSSNKLALLNYDWTNINAEDLMVLFNSLKPKSGTIQKVTVYPSEFGKKRMEEEEREGPKEIWEGESQEAQNIEEEKPQQKGKKHKKVDREVNEWIAHVNKPTEFDPIKLRKYEKDRLKYYYAVVECDTQETAEHIYNESDGTEFELSGMKLDLRFVPVDQKFPYEPKENCDYLPAVNKVNNFFNRALNHTNVELTWENPNMNRFDYLYSKNLKEEDWDKIDYSKILGDAEVSEPDEGPSDSDQNHEEEEPQVETKKYEQLPDWRADFDKKNRKRPAEDMEIRFTSGFQDLGNKMMEKKKEKEESTWEKYLQKRKEKKKMRKLMDKKKMKEEDYFIEPEQEAEERDEKKYEEELELLVDEKKGKRGDFNADVGDSRFKAIYEDSRFGINPTHKDFKVDGSGKYLKEVVERRKKVKKE